MEQVNTSDNQTAVANSQLAMAGTQAHAAYQPPVQELVQAAPAGDYAGFWLRYFAQIVDSTVWALNFFVPLYLLSVFGTENIQTFIPAFLWFLLYTLFGAGLIRFFGHPWLISRLGAGFGKLVCGLQITTVAGSRLTVKNALFRESVAKIASNALLGYGYYAIFKHSQKQAWHDELAGTYVVKKHSGLFAGLMVLVLTLTVITGLLYKSYDNFRNAKTLQYDVMTLITQIQQDFSSQPTSGTDDADTSLDDIENINDMDTNIESGTQTNYPDYENMDIEELFKQLENYKTQ